jgi:glycosyltransferase involved in cell wall biosynthesis
MKLLIVSGMAHYSCGGKIVGWGPTVQEIDHLSQLFDEVRHVGFLHEGPAPASALPYDSSRVQFIPVPPAGGRTLGHKIGILLRFPTYLTTILRELREVEAVHVRCPDNIALLAIVMLAWRRLPAARWVKYAGNWMPAGREAWSYSFQRWWLRHGFAGGLVTVNGTWPGQPPFVRPFLNPCLTRPELELAMQTAAAKSIGEPVRLIFVGRLETEKGAGRALEILARLRRKGLPATLDLVVRAPGR